MNWTALGAISTFLAVLVALFRPVYLRWRKNNKMEGPIEREIASNLRKIQHMRGEDVALHTGDHQSALERNQWLPQHLDLSLWKQFRFELAQDRPESYDRYHSVNRFAEAITEISSEELRHGTDRRRDVLLVKINSAAESFIEKCEELGLGDREA